jgi:YegS/Rv2252/BmrU family lipid kinase
MPSQDHLFVVLNPAAGQAQRDDLLARVHACFTAPEWSFEVHEMTGGDDVAAVTRAACERGATLVVAAGGDGTVLSVANGLIGTRVPLGILPVGTGNILARGLKIPLDVDEALRLLIGEHCIMPVDALKVDETYYVLNVSAGISPQMMRQTDTEKKKRFGMLAYVWTALRRINLFRMRHYRVIVDGQAHSLRATEVLVTNGALLEDQASPVGPPDTFNDQQLEVYVFTARNFLDYVRLAWSMLRRAPRESPVVIHFPAKRGVSLETRRAQLVQADGEIIGRTPIAIELVPHAVQIIVPPPTT